MAWENSLKWNVWLTGTNSNIITDAKSEILLSDLHESIQEVSTPNWIKVPILHLRENESNLESKENNGILINSKAIISEMEIKTKYFKFPDDITEYSALLTMFRNRYILICRDGFMQDESNKYPIAFHSEDKAILCSVPSRDSAHNSEAGIIDYQFTLRRQKPIYL